MRRRFAPVVAAIAVLAIVAPPVPASAAVHEIQASSFVFCANDFVMCPPFFSEGEYRTLVRVGTEVVWLYNDLECDVLPGCPGHNVTFPDEEPQTVKGAALTDQAEIRRMVFDELGTFRYVCTIHQAQGMTGFIGVIP